MSVRNRYASNSTKVSPTSSSSRLAGDLRITSKKLDDMVRSKYMGRNEDYYTKFSRFRSKKQSDTIGSLKQSSSNGKRVSSRTNSDPTQNRPKPTISTENYTKKPLKKQETQVEKRNSSSASSDSSGKAPLVFSNLKSKTSRMVEINAKITLDRAKKGGSSSKAAVVRRHSDSRYDTFPERREQKHQLVKHITPLASKQNTNAFHSNLNVPKEKIRRHSDSQCELRNSGSMSEKTQPNVKPMRERPKSFSDREDLDVPIFRPKSARPSSRWERRFSDDESAGDDDDEPSYIYETLMTRPKSARPESRILRHTELVDDSELMRQPTPPPRPTTSRGHRRSEENKDYSDFYLRNISGPDAGSSTGTKQIISKTSQKENIKCLGRNDKSGQSIPYDKSIHGFDPESFRKEQIKVMNAKDVLALNSGIDDIDLDIDPVVYFLQEDDNVTSTTYKPSLSKGVINIIGKANSEEHKPLIGYHSNNLNKQRHKSDGCDTFHNAEQPYLKSTFHGSEVSTNQIRRDKQKPGNKSKHHTYSYSDSSMQNTWQKSGTYDTAPDKLISKYSAAPSTTFADGSKHGFRQEKVYQSIFNQDDLTLRKPRKLEPLSGRFYPN